VLISTLPRHEQLGDAMGAEFYRRIHVTPELQAVADAATAGLATPADKAKALHNWVKKNIRYVAVYLGVGGYVPHELAWIWTNRYGDCKDHVLLLQSLLRAAGIDSAPAFINTYSEYGLTELPVPNSFNHVILYIPELGLFMDPTAQSVPSGSLPWVDADKPVVVALAQGTQLMRTPAMAAQDNRLSVRSHWTFDGRGLGALDMAVTAQGYAASELEQRLKDIPPGLGAVAVQRMLQRAGLKGRGFLRVDPPDADRWTQGFTAQLTGVEGLMPDPEVNTLSPNPSFSGLPLTIRSNMGNYVAEHRHLDMTCTPITVDEVFELTLDDTLAITRVPPAIELTHPDGIRFSASYRLDGQRLTGQRTFVQTQGRHHCSVAQYEARRAVFAQIDRHLKSNLLVQKR
jgi:hypothetical protein